MKKRTLVTLVTCSSLILGTLAGCGSNASNDNSAPAGESASADVVVDASADASGNASKVIANEINGSYTMDLSQCADKWTYNSKYDCYALENVVYCENPLVTSLQSMNIYVPAAYMNADGTVNASGEINGYTAETAPIIYKNGVAGYMEASPSAIAASEAEYMNVGFVYISVGSRGRATQLEDGTFVGKSPIGLVDLKAGIRMLKANDDVLAGSSERIVSVGTSAGGAMSSLLGVTGNSKNYDEFFAEMGAIMDASDDIYAAQCYCPITDLENADKAYEWEYQPDTDFVGFLMPGGSMNDFQIAISEKLAAEYIDYYNSLGLVDFDGNALSLDGARSGSAYEFVKAQLEAAATKHLTKMANGELDVDYSVEDYLSGNYTYSDFDFATMSNVEYPGHNYNSFLTWDGEKAVITDFDKYVTEYNRRLKACLAFDDLTLAQGENQEMGNETTDLVHFNDDIAPILEELKDDYSAEYAEYYDLYAAVSGNQEIEQKLYLLNPMNYLGTEEESDKAPYFRIRVGSYDPHTAVTVSMNLALKIAQTTDSTVDYATVWDQAHGEADYAGEFTAWVEDITK